MTSVVYFIQCAGRIKIGFSKNLKSRFSTLNTFCPETAEILATVPGGIELETIIHHKLRDHRHKHEWFNDCAPVRDLMAELVIGNPEAFLAIPGPVTPPSREPVVEFDDGDASDLLLADILKRFTALLDHPLLGQVRQACEIERTLAMTKGTLVGEILGGEHPTRQLAGAFDRMKRNYKKYMKVTDRLHLMLMDGGEENRREAPLRRAAEILIEDTEAAFRALEIKKPELQMAFLTALPVEGARI